VARFRKTAIAALAASALLLTPAAAYADHNHRGVSGSSDDSGMSWGYYSGRVIDYTTDPNPFTEKPDIFKGARASAIMIGMDDKSFFRLRVTGIKAKDGVYGVHLHQETCDSGDPVAAGPHYNLTWNPATKLSDVISNKTEVWLDLDVDSDGNARSTATVSFIPEEGTRSIVLHADPTAANGGAGARLACLPFEIKVHGN
jgi:Copper/zinc superoxide dismutase (SODC)